MLGAATGAVGLVARERDLAEVGQLLAAARLVTLTGPVGVGKSKLAAQFAADATWGTRETADLQATQDEAAAATCLREAAARLAGPGGSRLLLIDNCEPFVATVAEHAPQLLAEQAGLRILVTSRECLGVAEETVYQVRPLPLDEAAAFFVGRVGARRGGLAPEVSPEIRQVCERLDGLPLALELAAAQAALLTPAQIMSRLDDAMRLLIGPPHAGVARHRSLREALDWGARTLAPREQVLLRRLSAFAGPFTLDCAEVVCTGTGLGHDEVLPALARLVAMSLVGCDPSGAHSRYWMLAIVRQYAGRLLAESGEEEAIARALAGYAITCPEALSVADLLAVARRGEAADGLRLAAVAAPYWLLSGRVAEGAALLATMLAQAEGGDSRESLEHARALLAGGMLGCALGRLEDAARAAAVAADWCERAGDERGQLWAQALAGMASLAADPHAAARLVGGAAQQLPGASPWAPALAALHSLALAEAGQLAEAHDVAARAVEAAPSGLLRGTALLTVARAARKQGRLEAAQDALAAAESLAAEPGAMGVRAVLLAESCRLALDQWPDGVPPASSRLEEAVSLASETGSPLLLAAVLDVAGRSRLRDGKPQSARSAFARVTALSQRTGTVQAAAGILGLGQVALASGAASAAWTLIEEAHALAQAGSGPALHARTLQAVGDCAWALGDASRAWSAYHRALGLRVDAGLGVAAVESLESLACLAIEQDRAEYGARLLGAAEGLREAQGCPRRGTDGRITAAAASAEAALGPGRHAELRSDGMRLSLSEAVAYACRQRGPRQRGVGWVSLTPAERQVADLAAAGMTNREIGQKLFSSPRTVQAHLSHVFAKLGISSRKMLVAEIASRNRQLPLHVPHASI